MEHRIRTSAGVSEGCIRFAEQQLEVKVNGHTEFIQGRTGGIGQGGGGGPMAWISVIAVMIEAYRKLSKGAEAKDVLNLHTIMYWIVSYVDDNTLVTTFEDGESDEGIMRQMTSNLKSWQRLLQLTGGDIDVDKSQWCLLQWKYDNTWGRASLVSKKSSNLEIKLTSPIARKKEEEHLQQLDPWEVDRVLGVRLPMDGSMEAEFKYRLGQSKEFARKLKMHHYHTWMHT